MVEYNKLKGINIMNLKEYEFKLSAYSLALSTINFDALTIAPKLSSEYRNDRYSYLSGEYYNILTDDNFYQLLTELKNSEDIVLKRKAKLYLDILESSKALSKEEYMEFTKLKMDSNIAWEKAREENDYKIFEPYLIKLIETSKYIAKKRNANIKAYDLFLNDFEEGMNEEKYDEFFMLIKERIVPLIKEVVDSEYKLNDDILKESYDVKFQEKFVNDILGYLKFEKDFGYCSTSIHPFTNAFSKNDIRITTRYKDNELLNSIFSVIHEVGHGMFEHQISDEFDGSIIQQGITSGIHESQSRLFENYLGRNKSFWKYNYPILQNNFDRLKNVSLDQFMDAINIVKPSLIRTEADELTYPLHILIRYEIEKGLFNGSISSDNLNATWNEKYKEYLGVDVPNDIDGILQDVHWSDASFGYFPAYALGSAYSAQIYNAMKKELNVDGLLENNNFEFINDWLKNKIHNNAALYTPEEILIKATGEKFNPKYYIEYLEDKFKKIYKLG